MQFWHSFIAGDRFSSLVAARLDCSRGCCSDREKDLVVTKRYKPEATKAEMANSTVSERRERDP